MSTNPASIPSTDKAQPSPSEYTPEKLQTTPEKPPFDPSMPLDNKRYEQMCHLRLANKTHEECYKLTGRGNIKRSMAKMGASRIFAREEVKSRLLWLASHPETAQNAPGLTIPAPGKATPAGKAPRKADLALAQRKASEALFLAETPADIVKAVQACRDLGLIDTAEQAKADPTLVLQAILSYAGRTGAEICEQLGGLAFMLDKFLTVCKITWPELRATGDQRYPPAAPQPDRVE